MDVFGRNPATEEGRYFRASIWEWPSLHTAMVRLCHDLVDEATLSGMEYNEGAGPHDPRVCQEMARRIEGWLEGSDFENRALAKMIGLNARPFDDAPTLHLEGCQVLVGSELRQMTKAWVEFLRHCGGFAVW